MGRPRILVLRPVRRKSSFWTNSRQTTCEENVSGVLFYPFSCLLKRKRTPTCGHPVTLLTILTPHTFLNPQSHYNLRCSSDTLLLKRPYNLQIQSDTWCRLLVQLQNSGMHCHLKSEMPSHWTLFKLSLKLTFFIQHFYHNF